MSAASAFRILVPYLFWTVCSLSPLASARAGHVTTYRVHDETTLSEISTRLYGTCRRWPEIAKWNNLPPPFRIKKGQKLLLTVPPTITRREGSKILLEMWRKRMETKGPPVSIPVGATEKQMAEIIAVTDPKKQAEKIKSIEKAVEKAEVQRKFAEVYAAIEKENPEEAPRPEELSAEKALEQGQGYFDRGNFLLALQLFRKARETNSESVPAWISEIRTLQAMGNKTEATKIAEKFIDHKPELSQLPVVQSALNPGDP